MLFSSVVFLFLFLPLVLVVYYSCPRKWKNGILLIFSLLFYAWGEPVYVLLMMGSILVSYLLGNYTYQKKKEGACRKAKAAIVMDICFHIGLLIFYKYTDFFIGNLNQLLHTNLALMKLPLPLGISFYTFQTMSYTIDLYRGEAKPQKNIINLAAYITLFPQLIAGPIVRYQTVARQLTERKETLDEFGQGAERFIIGLGKKVLLANTAGLLYNSIQGMAHGSLSVVMVWLSMLAFTFQIYFDFSGYSDMAIGLGKMFGFQFLENFNYPYIARSITEFWRRWHISLSTWFRDYVYIPLGGSRKGEGRTYINLAVVWILTGFWHGASWNFVVWGAYFAVILMLEKRFLLKWLKQVPSVVQHIYAVLLIVIGWTIFSHDNLMGGLNTLRNMFGFGGLPFLNRDTLYQLVSFGPILFLCLLGCVPLLPSVEEWFLRKLPVRIHDQIRDWLIPVLLLLLMVIITAYLISESYNPFLYFRF